MKCIYYILVLLNIFSCSKSKVISSQAVIEPSIIEVNMEDGALLNTKDIASSVRYVPLETTKECLIGEVKKVIQTEKGEFIIFDSRQNKLFLFNSLGRFVTQIGTQGRGPNEYLYLNDVYYDPHTQSLYAFERMRNSMFVFDLKGEVVEMIPSEFSFNSFVLSECGFWIYSCFPKNNPNSENLMLVDKQLKMRIEGYLPQKGFLGTTMEPLFSQDEQGNNYFIAPFSNSIYSVSDKAVPCFNVNFKHLSFPFDQITESTTREEYDMLLNSNKYIGNLSSVVLSKRFLFFNCSETLLNQSVKYYTVMVDRESHKASVFNRYMNGFGDVGVSLSKIYGVTDRDELIYLISPDGIDRYAMEAVKETISKDISAESNPIIAFFQLK